MGVGPIPRSKLRDYAEDWGITGDAAEFFFAVIGDLDNEYLTLVNASSKSKVVATMDDPDAIDDVMNSLGPKRTTVRKRKKKAT